MQASDHDNDEKTLVAEGRERSGARADTDHDRPGARAECDPAAAGCGGRRRSAGRDPTAHPTWQQPRTPGLPFESRTPTPTPTPNPSTTLPGTGVPYDLARLGSEPLSEPGARPLIDDKLGWSTGIKPLIHHDGSATRLETNAPEMFRVRARHGWLILVVLMLLGLGAGVAIAVYVDGDSQSSP